MKKLALIATTALSFTTFTSASAHVVMEKWEAYAGYQTFVTLAVPHGCGLSPTTEVRIKVPDGIDVIVPEPKAGWTLDITMRKLDKPVRGEGGRQVTEMVDEISWKGGSLPTNHLGKFSMLARMPDQPGKTMFFKTIQKCAEGETKWIDTVADGEPTWKVWAMPAPAPFVELKAPPGPQLGATMQQIGDERKRLGKGPGAQ
jgi:periplasmic copper chaperone A